MNCPQCQTVNRPDAGFCGSCGARLVPSAAPAEAGGYPPAPGAPFGYNPAEAPAGYAAPGGDSAGSGYSAPGYQNTPPGHGAASGQAPNGYMQNAYQPGAYQPGAYQPGAYQPGGSAQQRTSSTGLPPVSFDLTRLTTVDKTVAVATFVTMISLWLPWYTATYLGQSSGSISGTADHGWLWLEFILALALIAYLAARAAWDALPFKLPLAHHRLLIAGTGVQLLLILIGFLALPSSDGIAGISIGWDFGAFLGLIGAVVAGGPVIYPAVKASLDARRKGTGPGAY
jgi:hypothetical protein